jgi:hypothetical protein
LADKWPDPLQSVTVTVSEEGQKDSRFVKAMINEPFTVNLTANSKVPVNLIPTNSKVTVSIE